MLLRGEIIKFSNQNDESNGNLTRHELAILKFLDAIASLDLGVWEWVSKFELAKY